MAVMQNPLPRILLLIALLFASSTAVAEDAAGDYAYYGFEPEIVTNYISNTTKLGYVRVSVELMIKGNSNLELVEHHAPLLRAAIVEILGQQSAMRIKSLEGREEIRQQCLTVVNELLTKETGQPLVSNLLFTKYLFQ